MEALNSVNQNFTRENYPLHIRPVMSKTPKQQSIMDVEVLEENTPLRFQQKPFIEANTKEIALRGLKQDCIIPVFSKDNEKTIAHQEFIEIAQESVRRVFPHSTIEQPEIRVSHQIKGRIPEAIHKPAKELLDFEKTQYWERMAFIIRIPSIVENVNGNQLSLIAGGVRAYNHENLYSKKNFEKFKFFIGFQNMVCCNMCISTDGFKSEIRVSSYKDLEDNLISLMQAYSAEKHLKQMQELPNYSLSERQFAQLIGKSRLYNYLPKIEKQELPTLLLNDGHISTIAKDYYNDESFCRDNKGDINLWNVFNLFTSANKSSYIDTFLDRSSNAFDFARGLRRALNGNDKHSWFLE